jgi:hypothetical protein
VADNVTLPATGAGDVTIPVRTSESSGGKQIQHVRLDLGSGASEAQASGTVPVTSTPALASAPNVDGTPVSVGTGAAVTVLAAFATRKQATLIPEGDVYMRLNGTAANTHAKLPAYTPYNISGYSGSVSMLSVSGTINVNVWEF